MRARATIPDVRSSSHSVWLICMAKLRTSVSFAGCEPEWEELAAIGTSPNVSCSAENAGARRHSECHPWSSQRDSGSSRVEGRAVCQRRGCLCLCRCPLGDRTDTAQSSPCLRLDGCVLRKHVRKYRKASSLHHRFRCKTACARQAADLQPPPIAAEAPVCA